MTTDAKPDRSTALPGPRASLWGWMACIAILGASAALSFFAASTKSPTFDEPQHLVGGLVKRYLNDHRIDPQVPALLGWMAALPLSAHDVTLDPSQQSFGSALREMEAQFTFVNNALHRPTPEGIVRAPIAGPIALVGPPSGDRVSRGTTIARVGSRSATAERGGRLVYLMDDGEVVQAGQPVGVVLDLDGVIARARSIFILVGVLTAALLALWAWRLRGPLAAVIATALFALDPTVIAQMAVVNSDVPLAFALLALAFVTWRLGTTGRVRYVALLGLVLGAAVNLKFSGVLFAPIAMAMLGVRAAMPKPWVLGRTTLTTVRSRFAGAAVALVMAGVLAYGLTWGLYGFRYAPTPDGALLNTEQALKTARAYDLLARDPSGPRPDSVAIANAPSSVTLRVAERLEALHVLPQAWTHGFIFTYATIRVRPGFLLGDDSPSGWWYYFPLAFVFKTPLASLVAILLAFGGLGLMARGRWRGADATNRAAEHGPILDLWTMCCVATPLLVYLGSALTWKLNIGVRHILPAYPFLFVVVAIVAAHYASRWRRRVMTLTAVLGCALAVETALAYPHYLAFFNAAVRSVPAARGGLNVLGDSNLDWGQDLPLLAAWRSAHRDRPLMLSYFGMVEPQFYGIDYLALPFNYEYGPDTGTVDRSGYVAISATNLQGTYIRDRYGDFREQRPIPPGGHAPRLLTVLGGSIYVYEWER